MEYHNLNCALDEIRLITILPATHLDQREDLISCTLDHYSLQDRTLLDPADARCPEILDWTTPHASHEEISIRSASKSNGEPKWRFYWGEFVALSYTWGNPQEKSEIMLNGSLVKVQKNLEAALRILRKKRPMQSRCKIWIDALCINQGDLAERSSEVQRMRLIYKLAANVVIWLGSEAESSDSAMNLIQSLSDAWASGNAKSTGQDLRQNAEHFGKGVWLALSLLLDRPYWRRMWIIQELSMGGQKAPILCGDKVVLWEDLFRAVYTFGNTIIDVMFSYIDRERRAAGLSSYGLNRNKIIHINDEQNHQSGAGQSQFMCLLDLGRKSEATDQRDKVYGILGLMDPTVSGQLIPDYTLQTEDVYTQFAQTFITATNSLDMLEQCTGNNNSLPSWVPDWTNKNHYRLFSGRKSTYHASGSTKPIFEINRSSSVLTARGVKVDDISGLGQSHFEADTICSGFHTLTQTGGSTNAYGTGEALKDALWRTLTGDCTPNGQPAPEHYSCLLDCPLRDEYPHTTPWRGARTFLRFLTQSGSLLIAGKRLDSYFMSDTGIFPEQATEALERLWRFSRTRRLMVTRRGRLGMAPHEAQKDDQVWVLLGCDFPVLVRPVTGTNVVRTVGPCYVHGIMNGETMGWINRGKLVVQDVSII